MAQPAGAHFTEHRTHARVRRDPHRNGPRHVHPHPLHARSRHCPPVGRRARRGPRPRRTCRGRALPAPGRGRRVPVRPPPRDPRRRHGARQDAAEHHRAHRGRAGRPVARRLPGEREAELGARDRRRAPRRRRARRRSRRPARGRLHRLGGRQLRPARPRRRAAGRPAVDGARVRRGTLPQEPHVAALEARAVARRRRASTRWCTRSPAPRSPTDRATCFRCSSSRGTRWGAAFSRSPSATARPRTTASAG